MTKRFSVTKDPSGKWVTLEVGTTRTKKAYATKVDALSDAKRIARKGATVIVHSAKGDINDVLSPGSTDRFSAIKAAPVKRRMSNRQVNIAIAEALESGDK